MADTSLICARFALYVLALGLAGYPLYHWLAGTRLPRYGLRPACVLAALLAMAASVLWAASSVAAMAAMPLSALDMATYAAVADATPIGLVLDIRLAAYAIIAIVALVYPRAWLIAVVAAIALATHALTGHAGAGEGTAGHLQRLLDVVHLLGAALWYGALLTFIAQVLGKAQASPLVDALERFARTGTAIVIVLAVTGAINGWLIARAGFAVTSTWSLLLAVKLALFAAMLGFAGLNRWKLTPALAAHRGSARQRLLVSLTLETLCATGIFAMVAVLGMMDPSGL